MKRNDLISTEFSLVDENGNDVGAGIMALLISNGGTVCDDLFDYKSAHAICREMGHLGYLNWDSASGRAWDVQSRYNISLDEVDCETEKWSSCTYKFDHDCSHMEDVFLQCDGVGELIFSQNV